MRIRSMCLLLVGALGGCVTAPPDHQQLVAQVTAVEVAFAKTMADRDFAAFLTFIADDAVFLGGEIPLRGRAAVAEGWKHNYVGPAPFSWKPERVEVSGTGSLAVSMGPVFAPDGSVAGHYSSTWRLDRDGHWRIVFDNGSGTCDCAKR